MVRCLFFLRMEIEKQKTDKQNVALDLEILIGCWRSRTLLYHKCWHEIIAGRYAKPKPGSTRIII